MEHYTLLEDLHIMCVTARSFPDGIMEAFATLEKKLPQAICERPFFGISKPNAQGTIVYKAGVEAVEMAEGNQYGLETFTLPKGTYLTETLHDFRDNMALIGATFQRLLDTPLLDPSSHCIEWYKGADDVMLMVKLTNKE